MKKNCLLTFLITLTSLPVYALATAEHQVILDFPVINTVEARSINTSAGINNDSGSLSNNMNFNFDISTNNESGSIAEFSALAETTSGTVNSFSAMDSNKNIGKLVLTNQDALPSASAVADALSLTPTVGKNNNVIAFQVKFKTNQYGHQDPVFLSIGDNIARGNVIDRPGSTAIRVTISNNSQYLNNTFDKIYDNAGTYEATIYCTVYSP